MTNALFFKQTSVNQKVYDLWTEDITHKAECLLSTLKVPGVNNKVKFHKVIKSQVP